MHYGSERLCRSVGHYSAAFNIDHMVRLLDYSYPLEWSHGAVHCHGCQPMPKKLQKNVLLAFLNFSKSFPFPLLSDATSRHRTDVEKASLGSSIKVFRGFSSFDTVFCHYNNLKLTNFAMSSSDD